ncbi:alpha/beta hydrolase [Alphaproteobacteria bacterium]|nr:alpha/beta hydrolase [Alphaproteobacteria bacterium]
MKNNTVKRGFVDISEGQIHYRYKGDSSKPPLVLLHPGPTSSHSLIPLIDLLGEERFVVAPDILGMGDSASPASSSPDVNYFSDAIFRTLDSLEIDSFDLWGCMTGAHCGIEMSLLQPKRVKRLYIEFIQFYDEKTQQALEKNHAPVIKLDLHGSQLNLLWHLARDQFIFFPWFERNKENARPNGLPSARQLHEKTVELLKSAETYHLSLNAALKYPTKEKLSQVKVPIFGPKELLTINSSAIARENFCVSPSTSTNEQVINSAKEILKHLD